MNPAAPTPASQDSRTQHTVQLIRRGATVAIVAAVLGLLGDLYHVTFDRVEADPIFKIHGVLLISALVLTIFALFALRLFHADRFGGLGRTAFWLALFGTVLVAGDIYYEIVVTPGLAEAAPQFLDADLQGWHLIAVVTSFAIFGAGWLLMGVAIAIAGTLSRPGAIALAIGGLVGFTPLPGSYLLLFLGLGMVGASLRGAERGNRVAIDEL